MVGDFIDAVVGDIAHRYPLALGRFEIDVVDADPVANNDFGPLHRVDNRSVDRCKLRDHCIGILNKLDESLGGLALAANDLSQRIEDRFLDIEVRKGVVGDRYGWHGRI